MTRARRAAVAASETAVAVVGQLVVAEQEAKKLPKSIERERLLVLIREVIDPACALRDKLFVKATLDELIAHGISQIEVMTSGISLARPFRGANWPSIW